MSDEGIVVSSGDADSFAEMRRIQQKERLDSQEAVRETLPPDELKQRIDDDGVIFGRPGPKMTRGQCAKQAAADRKEHRKRLAGKTTPATKKAEPKKATPKKAAPKKAAPKKAAPKKATSKKAAPKKATSKKAAPKKATPKKATPKKAAPKKATSKKATSKKATPKKAVAKKVSRKKK